MSTLMGKIGLWWMRFEISISPNSPLHVCSTTNEKEGKKKNKKNLNNRGGYLWFSSILSLYRKHLLLLVVYVGSCLDLAFKITV
jgi:hypothetical protein